MALSPRDRRLVGKRVADKLDAMGAVLISAKELDRLRALEHMHVTSSVAADREAALMRQVADFGAKLGELKRELRENAQADIAARKGRCLWCATDEYPTPSAIRRRAFEEGRESAQVTCEATEGEAKCERPARFCAECAQAVKEES